MMCLKKNLASALQSNPEAKLFFFDESRFGTHSKLGNGWFAKGSRTQIKVSLGFKNFYLYSAVSPQDGEDLTLIMPQVNSKCMNVFLAQMAIHLGDRATILVLDGAGWHKANNLNIPNNITLIFLPPYSPELNPVERLRQYLKQHTIKNKIYESIAALIDTVARFITSLERATVASICKLDYVYN